MKEFLASPDYRDDYWADILFEFSMAYSYSSFKTAYNKHKENEKNKVDADLLRKLGYSEEHINRRKM